MSFKWVSFNLQEINISYTWQKNIDSRIARASQTWPLVACMLLTMQNCSTYAIMQNYENITAIWTVSRVVMYTSGTKTIFLFLSILFRSSQFTDIACSHPVAANIIPLPSIEPIQDKTVFRWAAIVGLARVPGWVPEGSTGAHPLPPSLLCDVTSASPKVTMMVC